MRSSSLFRSLRARPINNRRRPTHRLALEALEDRLCFSSTVLDLGTLGGASSSAGAVNASGQVVGSSYIAGGTQQNQHAFVWQNGAMTDLGTLGGPRSAATDINDAGQIVGLSFPAGATTSHAFLWQSGIMTDLGTLGGDFSSAQAINNHGQIVGASQTASGAYHDFVWENSVMYDLDALLPANSGWVTKFDTIDINDNGQIAGTGVLNGVQRAFLISDGDGTFANGGLTITNLGTLGGSASEGYGINNSGQVVGDSGTKDGRSHAFRYSTGVMTDLKTLVGNPTLGLNISGASAISDAGQIVGTSVYDSTGSYHAVTWQSAKINDLNKELPRGSAWVLTSATDINVSGKIVGSGSIGGHNHAFLLVPSGLALQTSSVHTASAVTTLSAESSSTPTNSTGNGTAAQIQPVATASSSLRLQPTTVDQVLGAVTVNRSRVVDIAPTAMNDDVLATFFALD